MKTEDIPKITFTQFLVDCPPAKQVMANDVLDKSTKGPRLNTPDIQLHCDHDECRGLRFFECTSTDLWLDVKSVNHKFLTYRCRNCRNKLKTFAISLTCINANAPWLCFKYGENPMFGPPIPTRVYNLIGKERTLFLLGRKNENQGMGIGAFVYYRRVIENQKNAIFTELIKAVKTINPNNEIIQELEAAKEENQFSRAIETIHHALPESLFIQGYNPLRLLHSALSEGIHELSDEQCLKLASSIRIVLFELSDSIARILKDKAELNSAVDMLANRKLIDE